MVKTKKKSFNYFGALFNLLSIKTVENCVKYRNI